MKQSNKQLIKSLTTDVMGEAFVLQAIEYYANEVLSDSTKRCNAFINPELWQEIAKDSLDKIERRTI
jgi:hypothetical protein